jgi:nucleoside-diphosphate-sugar epimerase
MSEVSEPENIADAAALDDMLSAPPAYLVDVFRRVSGDVLILGVGGKMGPTLARMAQRASEAAGAKRRIIGVARFSKAEAKGQLQSWGIEAISADLIKESELAKLPDAPNVIYMVGMKFGSSGNEALTWAMNCFLPGMVAKRYAKSRIVAFSTGNVYGLLPVTRGGSVESDALNPMGDYAMSCVGRERILEHFSREQKTRIAIIRLNYAVEMRYGVIADLAGKVWRGEAVDLAMGNFNAIWQGDANAMSLACLERCATPPMVVNVSGPELLSVRRVAERLGELMGRQPKFEGAESGDGLLNNAQMSHRMFGYPMVPIDRVIEWTANWTMRGGETLNKPTHFETRDGKF